MVESHHPLNYGPRDMELSSLYVTVIEPSKVQRQIIKGHLNSFGIEQIEEFEEARPVPVVLELRPPCCCDSCSTMDCFSASSKLE